MPDLQSALFARLAADGPVAAVVVSGSIKRIYWGIVPQSAALPYIRLNTISDPRPQHLQGYDTARSTRVQVDCFAASYGTARGLAEKVVTALAAPVTIGGVKFGRGKAEGPRDLGEDTSAGYVFRARMDLLVEHSLA